MSSGKWQFQHIVKVSLLDEKTLIRLGQEEYVEKQVTCQYFVRRDSGFSASSLQQNVGTLQQLQSSLASTPSACIDLICKVLKTWQPLQRLGNFDMTHIRQKSASCLNRSHRLKERHRVG